MDTTRISIARVLALDVPLTWQDAVAVAQEAAMLSDVHAAMNSRPSLVSAESCFITRTGDLELPVMTDIESPDAVTVLLREMLAGRDAPEALETLAFGHATRDMTGALQQFPIANRRAEIAKLATRALALQAQPVEPLATTTAPVPPAVSVQPPAPPTPAPPPAWTPPVLSPAPYASTSGNVAVAPTAPPSVVVPFMRQAPFRAADVTEPPPPRIEPAVAAPAAASDAELLRLRSKSVARAQARSRWSTRVGLAFGRAAGAVTWRPASPDPRILGAAFVITAAVVSVLWTGDRRARPAAPAAAVAPPAAALALPVAPPSAGATASVGPAGSVVAASPPALPQAPRAAGRGGDVTLRATPASPAAAEPSAGPSAAAERLAAAPAPGRAGLTVTVPALDLAPDAPTTNPGEPRAFAPRPPSSPARADYGTVYSSSDGDVTPPVLLRQQLPSPLLPSPEEAPEDWPYLELVVDRDGAVEQVRLRARQPAPGQTLYRHRMLLAAAKAWQFEPARRHGAAVRYVVRVPLEP